MSKIISTTNAVVAQEQLFTNLTPEEASILEGGYNLYVSSIVCLKDGADTFSGDDVYANVTVDDITSRLDVGGMKAGDGKNLGWDFSFGGNAVISFFDSDSPDSDDALGGFSVSGPTNGIQRNIITGSGSTYRVSYSVS